MQIISVFILLYKRKKKYIQLTIDIKLVIMNITNSIIVACKEENIKFSRLTTDLAINEVYEY